jgi:hypothetical protein
MKYTNTGKAQRLNEQERKAIKAIRSLRKQGGNKHILAAMMQRGA